MNNVLVKTMYGNGDCIYLRPFIKHIAKTNNVYIETHLTRLFDDIKNVKFIKPNTPTYRTQQKEFDKQTVNYVDLPKKIHKEYMPNYSGKELLEYSIVSNFYVQFEIPFDVQLDWDLPDFSDVLKEKNYKIPDKKYAVIRPSTIRKEWLVETRNAKQNYIAWCTKILNEAGYHTISIADLSPKQEWLAENTDVPAKEKLYNGELGIYGTLELIKHADIVVGGSGFIIPATVSTNTPLFIIFGGRMLYDSVSKVFHPTMNLSKIGWSTPDAPCKCSLNVHNCNKTISTLDSDFFNFLGKIQ